MIHCLLGQGYIPILRCHFYTVIIIITIIITIYTTISPTTRVLGVCVSVSVREWQKTASKVEMRLAPNSCIQQLQIGHDIWQTGFFFPIRDG